VKRLARKEALDIGRHFLGKVNLFDKENEYPARLSEESNNAWRLRAPWRCSRSDVLFDEATSALDPELTGEVLEVMRRARERRHNDACRDP